MNIVAAFFIGNFWLAVPCIGLVLALDTIHSLSTGGSVIGGYSALLQALGSSNG
jgi:hypothetical protein